MGETAIAAIEERKNDKYIANTRIYFHTFNFNESHNTFDKTVSEEGVEETRNAEKTFADEVSNKTFR